MKRLLNTYEKATNARLKAATAQWGAEVYPKVRLADVFPIQGSGISDNEYSFALKSHFDFLVTDGNSDPLFAVEFDGPGHTEPSQVQNDELKSNLCRHFGFPLLRVNARYLDALGHGMDLLAWCIHAWFSAKNVADAERSGAVAPSIVFATDVVAIPGLDGHLPLWLSADARLDIDALAKQHPGLDPVPSCFVAEGSAGEIRAFAWLRLSPQEAIWAQTGMRAQLFDAPLEEAIEEIAIIQLRKNLEFVLAGIEVPQPPKALEVAVSHFKASYRILSYAGYGPPPGAA